MTSRQVAETATFQSFANCYLREVGSGRPVDHPGGMGSRTPCIEWMLPRQHAVLRAEVTYRSLCGPHGFGRLWLRGLSEAGWRPIEPFSALHALVHETYRDAGNAPVERLRACELELLSRVLQSYQATVDNIDHISAGPAEGFIAAEQSLVFGHWLHPTPKSRQGMTAWQQPHYAPERRGQFRLHFFAAKLEYITHNSATERSAPAIVQSLFGSAGHGLSLAEGEGLLPMHPLQAEALLLDPMVQDLQRRGLLRSLGPAGPLFTATSSVRTVYSADADWMLKFSLPVRITNSVRLNRRHELDAGVAMAKLFARSGFCRRYPAFRLIHDPAYITLDLPGRSESGFEVILRENPFAAGRGEDAETLAALSADPLPGQRSRIEDLVRRLAARSGEGVDATCRQWFARYLDVALKPLVALYDQHGVALEAHQQNSLIDVRDGWPRAYYYRDNQGFYLSERYQASLDALVPEAANIASLYHDEAEINDSFAYYLLVNQVFSVISRMGRDGLVPEAVLMALLRERLECFAREMTGAGRDFAKAVLSGETIATKANLVTRLLDIDELEAAAEKAVYTRMPNPLARPAAALYLGGAHALAS